MRQEGSSSLGYLGPSDMGVQFQEEAQIPFFLRGGKGIQAGIRLLFCGKVISRSNIFRSTVICSIKIAISGCWRRLKMVTSGAISRMRYMEIFPRSRVPESVAKDVPGWWNAWT